MKQRPLDSFGTRTQLHVDNTAFYIVHLGKLRQDLSRLPFSLRILLENLLRHEDGIGVTQQDIEAVLNWDPRAPAGKEISFMPSRVLLQDFTGVPAVVDLAAMRDAMPRFGGAPEKINPVQPVDLVIDHSIQIDQFGTPQAFRFNTDKEHERNRERYALLRWAQTAFNGFRVVPPGTGIVHQVNLEYLATVVVNKEIDGDLWAYPDTLVGTDSHTTMINGLGVLAWGVGGIEAEAAMLSQPIPLLVPEVVGFRLSGRLPRGATATDLVLTATQILRARGVVGRFVEFFGPGLDNLSLADRATIANMAPEYGATVGFFPVDSVTLDYLRFTGRDESLVRLVETYCKEQGLFRTSSTPEPEFSDKLELDLGSVEPSLAGPKRPQDRIPLSDSKAAFQKVLKSMVVGGPTEAMKTLPGDPARIPPQSEHDSLAPGVHQEAATSSRATNESQLRHGSVVIAAITSCTNTSNPSVLIMAGLLAKRAVERGLHSKPWVKTSLAPGSRVVTDYLAAAQLQPYLDALGFHLVGYGCTTCIGNSGPLPESVARVVREESLVAVAVLSGNRNFEGRINPLTRANYLASPPLVVAYALSGTMDIDFEHEPLGIDQDGTPVFLKDLWPDPEEVDKVMRTAINSTMFRKSYANVFQGDEKWQQLKIPQGGRFEWDEDSTYIKRPTFFDDIPSKPSSPRNIENARVLALLGDSVTTDHISPAGAFSAETPAGRYLIERGVDPKDFNSYGSRRGNHEVMVRGTFANIRLRNQLVPGMEGGWTTLLPGETVLPIYDAAVRYKEQGVPLIVIAGKEYGTGSSRDWAAKGTMLLGVRAVLAKSFERIHRSNLIGMGVLPLQFRENEDAASLGLTGKERYSIAGIDRGLRPRTTLEVRAESDQGSSCTFEVVCRVDTLQEAAYFEHGGILNYALRRLSE